MKISNPRDGYLVASVAGSLVIVGLVAMLFFGFNWSVMLGIFGCGFITVLVSYCANKSTTNNPEKAEKPLPFSQ
jgi:hypothetical protein